AASGTNVNDIGYTSKLGPQKSRSTRISPDVQISSGGTMNFHLKLKWMVSLAFVLLVSCVMQKNPPTTTPPGSPPPIGPTSCSAGQEWCNGSCVDTIRFTSDSSNCGRCGNRCSFNESCTGGFCDCAPGYEKCMGSCKSSADFIGDSSNCGRCGNICSIGE